MSTRLRCGPSRRALAVVATALAAVLGATAYAGTASAADVSRPTPARQLQATTLQSPPTRLWYRISATVAQTRTGGSFERKGNDPEMRVVGQYSSTVRYRLRSNHAVLLYRQCLPLAATETIDPKLYARLLTNDRRTTTSCAEVRTRLREHGVRAAEVRELHLAEDVRFTATTAGVLDEYERSTKVPAHMYRLSSAGGFVPGTVMCPPQTLGIDRVARLPLPFAGRLSTGSAVRDGVTSFLTLPRRPIDIESGSAGEPCLSDPDGPREPFPVTSELRLVPGSRSVVRERTSVGFFPISPKTRFRIGSRFGKAFTIKATRISIEPVTPSWQTEPWVTTLVHKLHFTPCPRGGRDVQGC